MAGENWSDNLYLMAETAGISTGKLQGYNRRAIKLYPTGISKTLEIRNKLGWYKPI